MRVVRRVPSVDGRGFPSAKTLGGNSGGGCYTKPALRPIGVFERNPSSQDHQPSLSNSRKRLDPPAGPARILRSPPGLDGEDRAPDRHLSDDALTPHREGFEMMSSRTDSHRRSMNWRGALVCAVLLFTCRLSAQEPVQRPLDRTTRSVADGETRAQAASESSREHPLRPALRIANTSLERLDSVRDYEAVLTKRELIQGELRSETMRIKFRETPFSVYLKFSGMSAGREVLYVEGRNQNNILAHEGSGLKALVGTVSLSPTSPEVIEKSRYSITDIGLRNMLQFMIERWEEEANYGEAEVQYYQNARLGERQCLVIECTHPRPRRQFRFHISRLFIDKETRLPVRVENYGFPAQSGADPPLEEEYTYSNLRTNVGLTDADFDRNNPNYAF
jgi:Protein of unknown function (DUF1571)